MHVFFNVTYFLLVVYIFIDLCNDENNKKQKKKTKFEMTSILKATGLIKTKNEQNTKKKRLHESSQYNPHEYTQTTKRV